MQRIFDTLLSQYSTAPTLTQLLRNLDEAVDPRALIDEFFRREWNVDTAEGYGLDVWGRIVAVGRVFQVSTSEYFGFDENTLSYSPFNQGRFYGGGEINTNFRLDDEGYRTLILAKAYANISNGSIPALTRILRMLFDPHGTRGDGCYAQDNGDMSVSLVFHFTITAVERSIIAQSGVFPKPAGISFNIVTLPQRARATFSGAFGLKPVITRTTVHPVFAMAFGMTANAIKNPQTTSFGMVMGMTATPRVRRLAQPNIMAMRGGMIATPRMRMLAKAAFTGFGSVTATPSVRSPNQGIVAPLGIQFGMSADPRHLRRLQATASLAGAFGMAPVSTVVHRRVLASANFGMTAGMTAAAVQHGRQLASASFGMTAGMTATARLRARATAAFNGVGGMTIRPFARRRATANFAMTASMTANAFVSNVQSPVTAILLNNTTAPLSASLPTQNAGLTLAPVTVTTQSGIAYTGQLVLSGADASRFALSNNGHLPCELLVGATDLTGGAYSVSITAPDPANLTVTATAAFHMTVGVSAVAYKRLRASTALSGVFGLRADPVVAGAVRRVFLTSGTSWTVPNDFNVASSVFELIGSSGAASPGIASPLSGGGGAQAGGYAQISAPANVQPGDVLTITVGTPGGTTPTTLRNNLGAIIAQADYGRSAVGTVGGNATQTNIGTITAAGGRGGSVTNTSFGGGGGGGAGGPTGAGAAGGASNGGAFGGGGGGGAAGGTVGGIASGNTGGAGGNNSNGSGGGAAGNPGAAGTPATPFGGAGGGGGSLITTAGIGGAGAVGRQWDTTHGTGGGGGGGAGRGSAAQGGAGAAGGGYGGAPGGGGSSTSGALVGAAGAATGGLIAITYVSTGNQSVIMMQGDMRFGMADVPTRQRLRGTATFGVRFGMTADPNVIPAASPVTSILLNGSTAPLSVSLPAQNAGLSLATITVTTQAGTAYTGTLTLTGADADRFRITGGGAQPWQLVVGPANLIGGTYSITIVAS